MGQHAIGKIKPVGVEQWLKQLARAPQTKALRVTTSSAAGMGVCDPHIHTTCPTCSYVAERPRLCLLSPGETYAFQMFFRWSV